MIGSLDIATLAAGYAAGSLTPADVVARIYDQISAAGERPVWISVVPRANAMALANAAPRGPLYGIPFAVKDNIDVAGLPTTCACPEFAYRPERSATVVQKLEAAGAIVIGKTNLDQFATGLVGTRSPYGIPSSVFDKDYISGGSSSGSAVAVASGLVSFALGTDTAGSGRVPAAFNNIVGLKPTKGLISTRGVVPACRSQDVVSIFALTVADAAHVLSVAEGFDAEDSFARTRPMANEPALSFSNLRLGVPRGDLEFFGDTAAAALYAATISRARGLGAAIVEIDFEPFQSAATLLYSGPWVAERMAAIKVFARQRPDAMHEVVRGIVGGADDISAVAAFEGFYQLADLIRAAEAQWQTMDAMLLPTAPATYRIADVLADPVRLNSNLGLYTNFVNLMDLSALAVPAGFRPNGLPFGVTLIARAFQDDQLAALGDRLHRARDEAKLGATPIALSATPVYRAAAKVAAMNQIAVVGAHLSGEPLNGQLTERGARLVRTTRTAAGYSFYTLAGTVPAKPGLVCDRAGAGGIEVEIWQLDNAGLGSFMALIPSPLSIGTIALADGSAVKGFLCEAYAIAGAEDITSWGGWRAWRQRPAKF